MRTRVAPAVVLLFLSGCGVELLTTTAVQSELQAEQLKAVKGQLSHAGDTTAKINIQRAIDTYQAEKGHYPEALGELVPAYLPSLPSRPDGAPYGYDPWTGKVLDRAVPAMARRPTHNDMLTINRIRTAIDQYGRATGYYPPSLYALAPTYLAVVPKTDSGEDFYFNPQDGTLLHPAQLAHGAGYGPGSGQRLGRGPGQGLGRGTGQGRGPGRGQGRGPGRGRGAGGVGPMGEVMTGVGMQQQLNSMGQSATSSAGGYARRGVRGATQQHDKKQQQAMDELGL